MPSKISFSRKQSVSAVVSIPWTDCFGAFTVLSGGAIGTSTLVNLRTAK